MPQANYYSTKVVQKNIAIEADSEVLSAAVDLNGLQRFIPFFVSKYLDTDATTTGLEIYVQLGLGFRSGIDEALDDLLVAHGDEHGILWSANEIDLTEFLEPHTLAAGDLDVKVSSVNLDIAAMAQYCRFRIVNTDPANGNTLSIYGAC